MINTLRSGKCTSGAWPQWCIFLVVCFVIIGGCAAVQANTPDGTARRVLDLIKSNRLSQARVFFASPETFKVLTETLGNDTETSVGQSQITDPSGAAVDVYLGGNKTTPSMTFLMTKTRDQWQITQIMFQ